MGKKNIITGLFSILIATSHCFGQTTTLPTAAQEAINKGIVAAKIPDYPLAVTYFQEARKVSPQSAEIFFNLGLAESNIPGRELRAICWFGAYLAANPTAANAAAVREQINTLDVKNKSNVIRLLNMVQNAASQIGAQDGKPSLSDVVKLWVDFGDIPAATKAVNLINREYEFYRGYALGDIADAQLEANDIEGAKKTTEYILLADIKCRQLLAIAEFQLQNADTAGAQKTLVAAFKTGVQIHNDPESGLMTRESREMNGLCQVAEGQARAGDIRGAQKTFEAMKGKTGFGFEKVIALSSIFLAQKLKGDNTEAQKTFLETQRAIETITYEPYKDYANSDIAQAQAKSGDITGAQKTAELIHDPNVISFTQPAIASAQAMGGDKSGAQQTLIAAQKAIELIKEPYEKVNALTVIAEVQAKTGDMVAAKKNLTAAQDTADHMQDEFWKSFSNEKIFKAYEKIGIKKLITAADWVKKLDDSNEIDDCPLNTEPFLDLDSHLKTVVSSNYANEVFKGLKKSAEKIVKARNIIMQLVK